MGYTMQYSSQKKIALKEAFWTEEMSQVNYGKVVACGGLLDQGKKHTSTLLGKSEYTIALS